MESGFMVDHFEIVIALLVLLGIAAYFAVRQRKAPPKKLEPEIKVPSKEIPSEVKPVAVPKISWAERLTKGLEKSRSEVWGKIGQLFSGASPALDEIEEVLYTADIPTGMVQDLLAKLEKY